MTYGALVYFSPLLPIRYLLAVALLILGPRLKEQLLPGKYKGKRATELVEPHDSS